jgi:hypothetical protein
MHDFTHNDGKAKLASIHYAEVSSSHIVLELLT